MAPKTPATRDSAIPAPEKTEPAPPVKGVTVLPGAEGVGGMGCTPVPTGATPAGTVGAGLEGTRGAGWLGTTEMIELSGAAGAGGAGAVQAGGAGTVSAGGAGAVHAGGAGAVSIGTVQVSVIGVGPQVWQLFTVEVKPEGMW